jgi:hypothetical protein
MLRLGSSAGEPTRGMPVCWKQKPPIAGTCPLISATPAGVTPSQLAIPGPSGRETKIWSLPFAVEVSCHATQGPGLVGSTALPPATDGFSASWPVLMFNDGTGTAPDVRACPENSHLPWLASPVLSKRLAKICFLPPNAVVSSYHVAHGTVRPAPAKSIAGASPSWP